MCVEFLKLFTCASPFKSLRLKVLTEMLFDLVEIYLNMYKKVKIVVHVFTFSSKKCI